MLPCASDIEFEYLAQKLQVNRPDAPQQGIVNPGNECNGTPGHTGDYIGRAHQ